MLCVRIEENHWDGFRVPYHAAAVCICILATRVVVRVLIVLVYSSDEYEIQTRVCTYCCSRHMILSVRVQQQYLKPD